MTPVTRLWIGLMLATTLGPAKATLLVIAKYNAIKRHELTESKPVFISIFFLKPSSRNQVQQVML